MSADSWLCGWRVASEIHLPDLMPWQGDERPPDIVVRLGEVPERLVQPTHVGPLLQVAEDGTCRYRIAGVAAFLVEGGRSVTVQPEMDPDAPDVRLLLLGSIFGFLAHQRGLLPLHAGCVEIEGRAVAFAGQSGVGKSTLTAAFARRGHVVLADDVTVVDVAAPYGPHILPAFPRLKLWGSAIDGLGLSRDGLIPIRTSLEKFSLPRADRFRYEPLPLAAVYVLETVSDERHAGIKPLRGLGLMSSVFGIIYRRMMALHAGHQAALMAAVASLGHTPVAKLARIHDLSRIDATVDTIIAHTTRQRGSGAA